MAIAVLPVEGVLRKLVGGALIPEGMRLYKALSHNGQIVLLTDTSEKAPYAEALDNWLIQEGFVFHSELIHCGDRTRTQIMHSLRSKHYDIDMVIEPDPGVAGELVQRGFNTLQFTHAVYAHPDWRPDADRKLRSWDSLAEQVATQARLNAEDSRMARKEE